MQKSATKIETTQLLRRIVLVGLTTALALWAAWKLQNLLTSLVLALFVSFALEPAVVALVKRGWIRSRATLAVFVTALAGLVVFLLVVLPPFITQASELVESIPDQFEKLGPQIEDLFQGRFSFDAIGESVGNIGDLVSKYASTVGSKLTGFLGGFGSAIGSFFTVALFGYFFLADGPRMRTRIFSYFKPETQQKLYSGWQLAIEKTGGYVSSRARLAVASAIFHSLAFWVIGIPSPLAFGLWVGVVSQAVPVVGAILAATLPLVAALNVSGAAAIWVIVALAGYQVVENYLIAPRITAKTMSLHPAVGFGAVIAGFSLFGAMGGFLALPLAAIGSGLITSYLEAHPVEASDLTDDEYKRDESPDVKVDPEN
jgi:predicted PurR-regulated permease PerM